MAEVLLRAIIRFPDKCPPELALHATEYHRHGRPLRDKGMESATWGVFLDALETYADALPAILADYEP